MILRNMINTDNKVSFLGGFFLTTSWSMTIYELAMALLIGIIGGFGGMIGKWIWNQIWK